MPTTYDITSSTQEAHTLKVQDDEVMSEVKVQGSQVLYEEMEAQRETDGTRGHTYISIREHPVSMPYPRHRIRRLG